MEVQLLSSYLKVFAGSLVEGNSKRSEKTDWRTGKTKDYGAKRIVPYVDVNKELPHKVSQLQQNKIVQFVTVEMERIIIAKEQRKVGQGIPLYA